MVVYAWNNTINFLFKFYIIFSTCISPSRHSFLSVWSVIMYHLSFQSGDNIHSQFSHFHGIFLTLYFTTLSYREVDIHWLLDRTPGRVRSISLQPAPCISFRLISLRRPFLEIPTCHYRIFVVTQFNSLSDI